MEELRDLVSQLGGVDKPAGSVPRLFLRKTSKTTDRQATFYKPMLYFVLQGGKQLSAGHRTIDYGPLSFLVLSIGLPVEARVTVASDAQPFLAVELQLAVSDTAIALLDLPIEESLPQTPAFSVEQVTEEMLDSLVRFVRLVDTPQDAGSLAPIYERELLYRVARSPAGSLLRDAVGIDGRFEKVRRAIDWIKANYRSKIKVEVLAELAGMSVTSFHRQFKAATTLSPIAYHQSVRLHEARRMLSDAPTVSSIAFSVGYESASQFNREYSRLFGTSPARDAARIRSLTDAN